MIGVSFPNKELWSSKKQQQQKKNIKFKLLRSCMKIYGEYGPPSSNNQSLKLDFSKLNSLHIAAWIIPICLPLYARLLKTTVWYV